MYKTASVLAFAAAFALAACTTSIRTSEVQSDSTSSNSTTMKRDLFGVLPDGKEVYRYVLTNSKGVEVHVINYGGIITHLRTPDRNGKLEDIVLGYDSLPGYLNQNPYFGAIVGRYGNRIAKGKFTLDGKTYTLVQNNNGEHLHGGTQGFDKVFWNIEEVERPRGKALKLTYVSPDMEEGYPGTLSVAIEYLLTEENALELSYVATTDKPTVVNLTQHTYFNLTGDARRDILDHELTLHADRYIPVTETLIPAGDLAPVKGTPLDFTAPTRIGERIDQKHEQLLFGGGYDHCWVLSSRDSLKNAALLFDPSSGRTIEVLTTEPGIQFYSGNFLDGTIRGKGGVRYDKRFGLCLETEHFPDSPNRPGFPSVVLRPGEIYRTGTIYRFGTR